MKLSLGRAGKVALLFGAFTLGGSAACADATADGDPAPDGDGGAAPLPGRDAGDGDAAPPAEEDAAVDAGPKACSDHGFCPTALPPDETVTGLWGDGAGVVWAATREGDVLRWSGSAWSVHATGLGELRTIWGAGPTEVWVGGNDGLFYGTGETSASIAFAPSALPEEWLPPVQSIWGASGSDVWAVASWGFGDGYVFHFTGPRDGGSAWDVDPSTWSGVGFTRVWGGHGTVWLAGGRMSTETWTNEVVVFYKGGGDDAFTEVTLPVDPDPKLVPYQTYAPVIGAVVASNASVTIYGQPESTFVKPSVWRGTSVDQGKTFTFSWAADPRRDVPVLHAVSGTTMNDVWAVGALGRVLRWKGTRWAPTAISVTGHPILDPFYAVWTHGSSEIWLGGKGMALRFDPAQAKDGGVQ